MITRHSMNEMVTRYYKSRIKLFDSHARRPSVLLLILPTSSSKWKAESAFEGGVAVIDPPSVLVFRKPYWLCKKLLT